MVFLVLFRLERVTYTPEIQRQVHRSISEVKDDKNYITDHPQAKADKVRKVNM